MTFVRPFRIIRWLMFTFGFSVLVGATGPAIAQKMPCREAAKADCLTKLALSYAAPDQKYALYRIVELIPGLALAGEKTATRQAIDMLPDKLRADARVLAAAMAVLARNDTKTATGFLNRIKDRTMKVIVASNLWLLGDRAVVESNLEKRHVELVRYRAAAILASQGEVQASMKIFTAMIESWSTHRKVFEGRDLQTFARYFPPQNRRAVYPMIVALFPEDKRIYNQLADGLAKELIYRGHRNAARRVLNKFRDVWLKQIGNRTQKMPFFIERMARRYSELGDLNTLRALQKVLTARPGVWSELFARAGDSTTATELLTKIGDANKRLEATGLAISALIQADKAAQAKPLVAVFKTLLKDTTLRKDKRLESWILVAAATSGPEAALKIANTGGAQVYMYRPAIAHFAVMKDLAAVRAMLLASNAPKSTSDYTNAYFQGVCSIARRLGAAGRLTEARTVTFTYLQEAERRLEPTEKFTDGYGDNSDCLAEYGDVAGAASVAVRQREKKLDKFRKLARLALLRSWAERSLRK